MLKTCLRIAFLISLYSFKGTPRNHAPYKALMGLTHDLQAAGKTKPEEGTGDGAPGPLGLCTIRAFGAL